MSHRYPRLTRCERAKDVLYALCCILLLASIFIIPLLCFSHFNLPLVVR